MNSQEEISLYMPSVRYDCVSNLIHHPRQEHMQPICILAPRGPDGGQLLLPTLKTSGTSPGHCVTVFLQSENILPFGQAYTNNLMKKMFLYWEADGNRNTLSILGESRTNSSVYLKNLSASSFPTFWKVNFLAPAMWANNQWEKC